MEQTQFDRRVEVYTAIDSERDYQDVRWAGHKHEVAGYITMMGHYYNELLEAWTKNNGDEAALHTMRKIAGIAVHCMEVHGAPMREMPSPYPTGGM